jgi:outer membrane protein OmpA-like peptidoglycan-associated protein
MKQESATKSPQAKRVLCVLSQEQWSEYQQDLDRMRQPGLEFVFQSSPDKALDQVGVVKPSLVIVGMTIGVMEGLEFLALLLRRYKDFDQNVIVLPNKGDPFPPMLQRRDPATGRSITEEVDAPAITALISSLAPLPSSMAARQLPESMRGEEAKEGELSDWESSFEGHLHDSAQDIPVAGAAAKEAAAQASAASSGQLIAEDRMVEGLHAGLAAEKPSPRARWPFVVVAVGIVGAAVAGFFVLGGGDEPQDEAKAAAVTKAASAEPKAAADTPDAPEAKQAADTPAAPAPDTAVEASTGAEAQPPDATEAKPTDTRESDDAEEPAFDVRQPTTLPLHFAQGSSRYDVSDEVALQAMVDTFLAVLERNQTARLEVGGHASSEGSPIANRVLGRRRATSVRTLLVGRGIAAGRTVIRSYGADMPAMDPASPGAVERNRRVTLRLVD